MLNDSFYAYDMLSYPFMNCRLIVVDGSEYLNDPSSYVVGDCLPLIGSPKANWSQVKGKTMVQEDPYDD